MSATRATSLASTVKDVENGGDQRDEHRRSTEEQALEKPTGNASKADNEATKSKPGDGMDTQKDKEAFMVDWEENDPDKPMNWSNAKKSWITFQLGMIALTASLGSSITSPAQAAMGEYTHTSREAMVLNVSLYVLGFAVGPLMWAPISETWGRKVSLLPPMVALAIFSIGVAVSENAASIFICRFFSGVFASAPVSNVSAALGDIWHPRVRGTAVSLYAVCVVGGPTIGPTIGAALTTNPHLGWRWTAYLLAIWSGAVTLLLYFQFPEVYPPFLLKRKAQRMRKETGDDRWWHPHENLKLDLKTIVTKYFTRPVRMLLTEPMVTCIAIYASFVYGIVYMTLEVFPIAFQQHRHWGLVVSTLPFLAEFVGVLAALGINLSNQPRVRRIVDANNGKPVPESRLAPMVVGGFILVIGLFWFGWTADPNVFWLSPVIAAAFIGAGFNIIFQQCINFLVDTYSLYAASAVSANTFLRSLIACALPLAAQPMFNNLGIGPAMSILGGIAVLALPVPFLFMRYGLKLRKKSKFAPVHD